MKLRSLALRQRLAIPLLLVAAAVAPVIAAGCAKKDGGDPMRSPTPTPSPTATPLHVTGHARFLHGPTTTGSLFAPFAPPANGHWAISPDEARLTFVSLTLVDASNGNAFALDLPDCTPSYVRTSAALSQLADCTFSVPIGTFSKISLGVLNSASILVNDATNGFYTTPSVASGVSTTVPTGGAKAIAFLVPGAGGVITATGYLSTALTVTAGSSPSIDIVVDLIHTVAFDVAGSTVTIDTATPAPPALFLPMLSAASGRYEMYSPLGTTQNVLTTGPADNDSNAIRIFYATPPQPSHVFSPVAGPNQAWSVDPRSGSGARPGGWLGLDTSGRACWALPANDFTWTSYDRVCELVVQSNLGAVASLTCQTGFAVAPPPVSGPTYASGCPAITPDITRNVTLIAH